MEDNAHTSVMILREVARQVDLAMLKRMKEQNDAEYQAFTQAGVVKETVRPEGKPKPDLHEVTVWVRKHWHKYKYNQRETVRMYVETHSEKPGINFSQELNRLKYDLKQNPLSKPKKSD